MYTTIRRNTSINSTQVLSTGVLVGWKKIENNKEDGSKEGDRQGVDVNQCSKKQQFTSAFDKNTGF